MDAKNLLALLQTLRLPLQRDEHALQAIIEDFLSAHHIPFQRECTIAPHCRIDFLIGDVGLEIKRGHPQSEAVRKQLLRYAGCDALKEIIVLTEHTLRLPKQIQGKPCYQLSLTRLWGIAL